MEIIGEKIILRAVEESDNDMLLELINDPETEMMIGGASWPNSKVNQMKWFDHLESDKTVLRCIVAKKDETRTPVGTVILNEIDQKNGTGHVHIKMSKEGGRGQGFGTEAINVLVKYAFEELRLNCVYANILSYNDASIHLFEKCGFKKDGTLRSRIYKNGKYWDVFAYSIIKEDITPLN